MTEGSAFDMRAQYTKYEYQVPMRDGTRLFTSVLVPKDDSTTYPILLMRSPFGVGPYVLTRSSRSVARLRRS